jgi:ABC-type transport system involved in multi-copper enzyme maturation permease subunit
MRDGLVWGHVIGLLVVAAALLGLALAAFQRRDVGV